MTNCTNTLCPGGNLMENTFLKHSPCKQGPEFFPGNSYPTLPHPCHGHKEKKSPVWNPDIWGFLVILAPGG